MKNLKTYEKFNIGKFKEKYNKFFNSPYEDDSIALNLIEYVSNHDVKIDEKYNKYSFFIAINDIEENPFGEDAEGIHVDVKITQFHVFGNNYALFLNGDKLDVDFKIIAKLFKLLEYKYNKKKEEDKKNRINKYKENIEKI